MGVCYKKENSILYTSIVHISPVSPFISLFSHSLFYMYSFEEIKRFSDIFFKWRKTKKKPYIQFLDYQSIMIVFNFLFPRWIWLFLFYIILFPFLPVYSPWYVSFLMNSLLYLNRIKSFFWKKNKIYIYIYIYY